MNETSKKNLDKLLKGAKKNTNWKKEPVTTFEIINSDYKVVSSGLSKSQVLYAFVDKKINRDGGFFIRDSQGLDMSFNEFYHFYCDEY